MVNFVRRLRQTLPEPSSNNPMSRVLDFMRRSRENAVDILVLFVFLQIILIVASLLFPEDFRYTSAANISVMLKAIPTLGIIALGVGLLMIAGEFDLSVGANYTLSALVMARLFDSGMPVELAVLIALSVGVGIGLLNGFLTLTFRLPSFIVTLGMLLFWQGMTLLYHGASSMRFRPPEEFVALTAGNLGIIEAAFVWLLILVFIGYLLLHRHRLGNHFFAVGGNRQSAIAIGINPNRVKMIAFAIAGFCAAASGILATARVGSIQPGQGAGLELQAIAACVIGGVALTGGRGAILGIFCGAALIYTIQDVLLLIRAPGFYLDIFVGVLIILAAIFNQIVRREGG